MKDKELEKLFAQKAYCKETGLPFFAPNDGICYRCKKNIFSSDEITLDYARNKLITGCPYCCYSFCE